MSEKIFWDYGTDEGDAVEVVRVELPPEAMRALREWNSRWMRDDREITNLTEIGF